MSYLENCDQRIKPLHFIAWLLTRYKPFRPDELFITPDELIRLLHLMFDYGGVRYVKRMICQADKEAGRNGWLARHLYEYASRSVELSDIAREGDRSAILDTLVKLAGSIK